MEGKASVADAWCGRSAGILGTSCLRPGQPTTTVGMCSVAVAPLAMTGGHFYRQKREDNGHLRWNKLSKQPKGQASSCSRALLLPQACCLLHCRPTVTGTAAALTAVPSPQNRRQPARWLAAGRQAAQQGPPAAQPPCQQACLPAQQERCQSQSSSRRLRLGSCNSQSAAKNSSLCLSMELRSTLVLKNPAQPAS